MLKQAGSSRRPQELTQIGYLRTAALICRVPVKGPRQLDNACQPLPQAADRHEWQRTCAALSQTAAPTCQSGFVQTSCCSLRGSALQKHVRICSRCSV